jgi:hypothetical protein
MPQSRSGGWYKPATNRRPCPARRSEALARRVLAPAARKPWPRRVAYANMTNFKNGKTNCLAYSCFQGHTIAPGVSAVTLRALPILLGAPAG